ncbi:hypothetical protein ES705_40988 [subsurface metagenome]
MVLFSLIFILSCSNDGNETNELWTYIGLRQVDIEFVDTPETILTTDMLEVYMWGFVFDADKVEFSHVEEVRDFNRADVELWAKAYEWSVSYPPPPTDLSVSCTHRLDPPFHPGSFTVIVHSPNKPAIEKEVNVID